MFGVFQQSSDNFLQIVDVHCRVPSLVCSQVSSVKMNCLWSKTAVIFRRHVGSEAGLSQPERYQSLK